MGIIRSFVNIFNPTDKKLKHKGHELIINHESEILGSIKAGNYVIEVGSDREAGSTYYISKLSNKHGLHFITVDIDPLATARAEEILKKINTGYKAVNDYGESFLKQFNHPVSLVYLDAFDIPGAWHTKEVIESYINRDLELTLENCHKMHYDCAVSICEKMPVGGYVCFDDVNPVDDSNNLIFDKVHPSYIKWSGKGTTAIPYLINNGFEIIDNMRACALLKRIK